MKKSIDNSIIGNSAHLLCTQKMSSLPILFLLGFISTVSAQIFSSDAHSIYTTGQALIFESDKSNNKTNPSKDYTLHKDSISITQNAFVYNPENIITDLITNDETEIIKVKKSKPLFTKKNQKKNRPPYPEPKKHFLLTSNTKNSFSIVSEHTVWAIPITHYYKFSGITSTDNYFLSIYYRNGIKKTYQSLLFFLQKNLYSGGIRPPPLL